MRVHASSSIAVICSHRSTSLIKTLEKARANNSAISYEEVVQRFVAFTFFRYNNSVRRGALRSSLMLSWLQRPRHAERFSSRKSYLFALRRVKALRWLHTRDSCRITCWRTKRVIYLQRDLQYPNEGFRFFFFPCVAIVMGWQIAVTNWIRNWPTELNRFRVA